MPAVVSNKRSLLSALVLASALGACSSGSSQPWPDRPLVATTADIGPHKVRLLLPKGVGKYDDPNGIIWRDVSPDYAFFIKVFAGEHPESLDKAIEDLAMLPDRTIIMKKATADGYELVVEEPEEKQHTVYVWRKRDAAAVSCAGILGRKIGSAAMRDKSNAWIAKICRSVEIQ